jgi:glycosyltransferase involved in cell wall biosynthesis
MSNTSLNLYNSRPLVSVIILSHNRRNLIEGAIISVQKQKTNFPFEIIIGDDFSQDGTREFLINYQKNQPCSNIVLNFSSKNIKVGANFFSSLRLVKGKYFGVLADDDYWHCETKLQQQVDFLEEYSQYGLVHTDYRHYNIKTNKFNEVQIFNKEPDNLQLAIHLQNYRILMPTGLYRSSLLEVIDFEKMVNMEFSREDWPFLMYMAKYTKFAHMPISTYTYRIGHYSNSNRKDYESLRLKFTQLKDLYKYFDQIKLLEFPYDEQGWDVYINTLLMNLAFKRIDYNKAKKYGAFAYKSIKQKCSQNPIMFYLFVCLKALRGIAFHN